jgi:hypothetical protein
MGGELVHPIELRQIAKNLDEAGAFVALIGSE